VKYEQQQYQLIFSIGYIFQAKVLLTLIYAILYVVFEACVEAKNEDLTLLNIGFAKHSSGA